MRTCWIALSMTIDKFREQGLNTRTKSHLPGERNLCREIHISGDLIGERVVIPHLEGTPGGRLDMDKRVMEPTSTPQHSIEESRFWVLLCI